jgi:hypothetical protein
VPGRLLHDFRRTAVRNLERAGVPRAMAMVGHRTESIYRRYAIVAESDLRAGAEKLAALHATQAEAPRVVVPSADARSASAEPSPSTKRAQFGERVATGAARVAEKVLKGLRKSGGQSQNRTGDTGIFRPAEGADARALLRRDRPIPWVMASGGPVLFSRVSGAPAGSGTIRGQHRLAIRPCGPRDPNRSIEMPPRRAGREQPSAEQDPLACEESPKVRRHLPSDHPEVDVSEDHVPEGGQAGIAPRREAPDSFLDLANRVSPPPDGSCGCSRVAVRLAYLAHQV